MFCTCVLNLWLLVSLSPLSIHNQSILSIYPLTFLSLSKQHFHNILFFSRVHLWLCMDNSITPDSEVLPKTSGLGDSDTIALPVGSSGIPSFISVFVPFIFIKDRWVLFKRTNSAFCVYRDTITRRVALPGSERPIYPHRRMVIPSQIPNLLMFM